MQGSPPERHLNWVMVGFCDGHVKDMRLGQMDDFDGDGNLDNGWWNGRADAGTR